MEKRCFISGSRIDARRVALDGKVKVVFPSKVLSQANAALLVDILAKEARTVTVTVFNREVKIPLAITYLANQGIIMAHLQTVVEAPLVKVDSLNLIMKSAVQQAANFVEVGYQLYKGTFEFEEEYTLF